MTTSDPTSSKVPDRKEEQFMSIGSLTGPGNMVSIYVGPEKKCWMIHEAVICNKSTFIRNAFRSNFAEGTSKTMTLEDDGTDVFSLFVDWIYGWDIDLRDEIFLDSTEDRTALCGLDIFADKIASFQLRQCIASEFESYLEYFEEEHTGCRFTAIEVETIFEKSPVDSPFRQELIWDALDIFMKPDFNDFDHWGEITSCSKNFAVEIAKAVKEHIILDPGECKHRTCCVHDKDPNIAPSW